MLEIQKLSDAEVREFFGHAFDAVKIEVENDAMEHMVRYSSGLPLLMHEIGDAIFWKDTNEIIDTRDAFQGIFSAAENVGRKYLEPQVYRAIRSERYRSILRKLGQEPIILRSFEKKDIEGRLNQREKKVFHNFLRRMRDLGVIQRDIEHGLGTYKFMNEIYPVYIWMESVRYQ